MVRLSRVGISYQGKRAKRTENLPQAALVCVPSTLALNRMQSPTIPPAEPSAAQRAAEALATPTTTPRPLPEQPLEPQMLLDPDRLLQISLGIAALALIAGLVLLIRLWWRRRSRNLVPAPRLPIPRPVPATAPASPLLSRVQRLHRDISRDRDYREGGHQLARLLRSELAHRLPTAVPLALTAEQLGHHTDADVAGLARRLRTARFSKRPPNRQKFTELCAGTLLVLEGDRAATAFQESLDEQAVDPGQAKTDRKRRRSRRRSAGEDGS